MFQLNIKTVISKLQKPAAFVDWKLLAFLVLFLNVKTGVKVFAIILIYILQFDLSFHFKFKNSRLPLFYPIVIGIAFLNWIIYSGYTHLNYNLVFLTGIGFWLFCILAIHQVKISVEKNTAEVIHHTIVLFFVFNTVVSLLVLLNIIHEIHSINPYRYQGLYQKYFIGTGDFIKGLTFDVSTTNAVLNAFGVIYFLFRKNGSMMLTCMAILILTGSNTISIMLSIVLLLVFIFNSTRDQKSLIMVSYMFLVVFMVKISPQNDDYLRSIYYKMVGKPQLSATVSNTTVVPTTQRPDDTLSADEKKEKIARHYLDSIYKILNPVRSNTQQVNVKPEVPTLHIHTAPFQNRPDTTAQQLKLISFVKAHKTMLPEAAQTDVKNTIPGKVISVQQTIAFLYHHPAKIITGNGAGNFSSKLAFKATGLGIAGSFPSRYAYISSGFLTNHLDVYLNFFTRRASFHSLTNNPSSVYNQLLSEYGTIGVLAFVVFYIGYYLRHYKKLTYGIPLLILLAGVLWIDYWFEQLSIIVFFELLLLLNIKETTPKTLADGN